MRAAAVSPVVALETGTRLRQLQDPNPDDQPRRPRIVVGDTVVVGDVSFYGPCSGPIVLAPHERKMIGNWVANRALQPGLGGSVMCTGNRLGRLLVADEMIKQVLTLSQDAHRLPLPSVYESFLMSDNVLDGVGGDILARHVALAGNEFTINAATDPRGPLIVLGAAHLRTSCRRTHHTGRSRGRSRRASPDGLTPVAELDRATSRTPRSAAGATRLATNTRTTVIRAHKIYEPRPRAGRDALSARNLRVVVPRAPTTVVAAHQTLH